ncbi:MAG: hypothetical protein LBP37_06610, partial [Spirochaetaceae bacterium]|nr:hypothetical protein [Spirochaetaceae bacterium]
MIQKRKLKKLAGVWNMAGALFAPLFIAALLFAACEQETEGGGAQGGGGDVQYKPPNPPANAIRLNSMDALSKIGSSAGFSLDGDYVLDSDISLANWTPPGTASKPFTGSFYGEGHTITITGGSGGLFGYLKNASVYNVKVTVTASAKNGNIGGIAAYMEKSLIDYCTATVNLTLAGTGHNASAGGIVGTMGNYSTVRNCTASGTITLNSAESGGFMVYAGGIAGYSGTPGQAGDGASGCLIEKSGWNGSVTASGGYPYAGGIVGYNYTGAEVRRCSAAGTVRAAGGNLPYAGGVAGYNAGYGGRPSLIENCYSTAAVTAESSSRVALAGGVAGANAAGALISKCYARGAVTARVAGNGSSNPGGSIGPMIAASAGGIAGAQYVTRTNKPTIKACAALNASITGRDSASGA